ncbi:MAG: hypothetical protein GY820_24445 [Gammaproteobacteria bacterium]|nr:hypothetical protein [Gammaproteobacteria bacterium]
MRAVTSIVIIAYVQLSHFRDIFERDSKVEKADLLLRLSRLYTCEESRQAREIIGRIHYDSVLAVSIEDEIFLKYSSEKNGSLVTNDSPKGMSVVKIKGREYKVQLYVDGELFENEIYKEYEKLSYLLEKIDVSSPFRRVSHPNPFL